MGERETEKMLLCERGRRFVCAKEREIESACNRERKRERER